MQQQVACSFLRLSPKVPLLLAAVEKKARSGVSAEQLAQQSCAFWKELQLCTGYPAPVLVLPSYTCTSLLHDSFPRTKNIELNDLEVYEVFRGLAEQHAGPNYELRRRYQSAEKGPEVTQYIANMLSGWLSSACSSQPTLPNRQTQVLANRR
jgi:hypothetical protein